MNTYKVRYMDGWLAFGVDGSPCVERESMAFTYATRERAETAIRAARKYARAHGFGTDLAIVTH
jgi:hypothetical protein